MQDAAATAGGTGPEGSPEAPPAPRHVEPDRPRSKPGPLASLRWRDRLSTQLLLVAAGLVLAAVIAFTLMEVFIGRQRLEGVATSTEVLSEGIKGAVRHAMAEDRREQAYSIVRGIARLPAIAHVRLVNKEGRITFSTIDGETGEMIDKRAEGCSACHRADQTLSVPAEAGRWRVSQHGDRRVLAMVTPFRNEPSCATAACHAHPPQKQVLGVLDVGVSLAAVDRDLAAFRQANLLVTGVAALLLVSFFWIFAQRRMVRPVEALLRGTRRVAQDQLDTEIRVGGRGELGLLAASFNEMTRSLRRVEAELRDLTSGLEIKVAERTAALEAAQDSLVRSEKLSSLGKLSASIAHEINNPLAGILTFAKLMIRTVEHGPVGEADRKTLVRQLELVQRETERCSAIVRNLLDFARERPLQLREVNLNAAVEEALSLIANQAAIQGVELVKDVAPLPPVMADFGQMRQSFVNIALNAVEATQKGGRLTVTTRPLPEQDSVEIVFADTGRGIPPEVMQHIFDPFFTTKEKGTGLGLSVVYGIIARHHGHLSAESREGEGARFTIRLPVARG
ncbi:MAG TPA: ATP-binding protein [Anaeromyxobacteraceae bacterium]|nr:ATP-binding protein [Anaeromyxobacteraceae bacterium]